MRVQPVTITGRVLVVHHRPRTAIVKALHPSRSGQLVGNVKYLGRVELGTGRSLVNIWREIKEFYASLIQMEEDG